MIIPIAFSAGEAMDRVFDALADLPAVMALLPAVTVTRVTEAAAARQIDGEVEIVLDGEVVTYRGSVLVAEADRDAGSLHLILEGRRPRHRAVTKVEAELRLRESAGTTIGSFQATASTTGGRPEAHDPEALRAGVASVLGGLGAAVSEVAARSRPAAPAATEPAAAEPAAEPAPAPPAEPAAQAPEPSPAPAPAPPPPPEPAAQAPEPSPAPAPAPPPLPEPAAQAPAPALPPRPRPSLPPAEPVPVTVAEPPVEPPAERPVPGRVELVTAPEHGGGSGRPEPLGDLPGRDRRPWLVPAVLLGGLAVVVILIRRRRDAG